MIIKGNKAQKLIKQLYKIVEVQKEVKAELKHQSAVDDEFIKLYEMKG